jgi:hypothetical protein
MEMEDVVKMVLLRKGLIKTLEDTEVIQSQAPELIVDTTELQSTDDNTTILDNNTPENEELNRLIGEIIVEFVKQSRIKYTQLSILRRVFKRMLWHLCQATNPVTLSDIRKTIDPRFRSYVLPLLTECSKVGILTEYKEASGKIRWSVVYQFRAQAIHFSTDK